MNDERVNIEAIETMQADAKAMFEAAREYAAATQEIQEPGLQSPESALDDTMEAERIAANFIKAIFKSAQAKNKLIDSAMKVCGYKWNPENKSFQKTKDMI